MPLFNVSVVCSAELKCNSLLFAFFHFIYCAKFEKMGETELDHDKCEGMSLVQV